MKGLSYTETEHLNGGNTLFIVLLCFGSTFSLFRNINEWQIYEKWSSVIFVFLCFLFCASIRIFFYPKDIHQFDQDKYNISLAKSMTTVNVMVSLISILQYFGLIESHSEWFITADFDNPAGISTALCISFPFASFLTGKKKYSKIAFTVLVIFNVTVLSIIGSRTGLLSMVSCIILISVFFRYRESTKLKIITTIIVVAVCVVLMCLFLQKKNSTNGRLLILFVSLKMFLSRPWFGYGFHGFAQNYMLYQADYLLHVDSSTMNLLADNITHPLSEFILIAVNFGLIGLLLLSIFIWALIKVAKTQTGINRDIRLELILVIFILSLFSYPFRYPITWISMIYCIMPAPVSFWKKRSILFKKMVSLALLAFSVVMSIKLVKWYNAQICWKEMVSRIEYDTSSDAHMKEALLLQADHVLGNNARYLYTRAMLNYYDGDYESSLNDACLSRDLQSCYDTELLLGNIFIKTNDYNESECHFRMAARMCPSRIMPLYCLFNLFDLQNDTTRMTHVGEELLNKPLKVASAKANYIRSDVRRRIFQLNSQNISY